MDAGSITRHAHCSRPISKVCALVFLLISVSAAVPAKAQASSPQIPLEHRIKAACLYRFLNYIAWPPDAAPSTGGAIAIGVIGVGPILPALQTLDGLEVDGVPLVVKRLSSAGDLGSCHILFVSEDPPQDVGKILAKISGAPVLTVGESPEFTSRGGMVRLYVEEKRARFEINTEACRSAGLKVSSRLLRLATVADNGRGR